MYLTHDDPQLQELIDLLAGQSYRKHFIQDGRLPGGPDLMIGFYNQKRLHGAVYSGAGRRPRH